MADKEIKPHQLDEVTDVKTNETQATCQIINQEENDHKVTSTDTDAIANSDDAHTQAECMVENATKGSHPPFAHHDRGDCKQTQEENQNKIHCADGPHIKSNEFGDSSKVSTKKITAAPPVDQDKSDQEENLNKMHCDDDGTFKSNPTALSQEPPISEKVSDKDVITIGPTIQEGSAAISDVPATVRDKQMNIGEKVDGSHVKSEESEDSLTVSSKGTAAAPAGDDDGTFKSNPTALSQEPPISEKDVKTIGPTIQAGSAAISDVPATVRDNKRRLWIGVVLAVVVAALLQQFLQPESPPQKTNVHPIDIFRQEMEKVKLQFPSQREELWKRSRIHLQRHFLIAQPTEPVSIILTAGVRAEGTLRCLARSIASALSSALNASALHLEGASKSNQDSDMVKSDIDSQLQKAFEGGKPIAVIHRFEELPPASTLIFYRYCDHENAAFKKTFLIFTVLLGEEEEIDAKIRLSEVEEMVTDHLQKKFLAHDHPTAFDKMDIDKYGGLWSRISHLILPVSTERRIEKTGQC
ncbi:torsin-1A-interacting protein 2-like isoform X2 [Boleophthalmus pectinirostris]|uniref:torsin-1A-interacting protein 2-like isoform X2 n=1 Tax=Boleophthalmus pectinirostris TaxID=150288 RepID=UPI00242F9840|nr:torsin-1A-interacting protein 2-like isoform X2 [Boleophthalmus pectinirostris]